MTGRELDELRRRIDAAKRERLRRSMRLAPSGLPPTERYCVECGGEIDGCTAGCERCANRHARRRRRAALA